jgi:uncharacterized protein (TIGR02284 family)
MDKNIPPGRRALFKILNTSMMKKEKTVDALNKLVEINNDRIAGYETAAKETDAHDLRVMFGQFAQKSRKWREELSSEVIGLGGTPEEGTKTTGKLYRVWMDVKAALSSKDRKAILSSCEFGEDTALKAYEDVLKNDREHLNAAQFGLVNTQMSLLKEDHDRVKSMRDAQ